MFRSICCIGYSWRTGTIRTLNLSMKWYISASSRLYECLYVVYVVTLSHSDHCHLHLHFVLNLPLWGRDLRQVLDVVSIICELTSSRMLPFSADCRIISSASSSSTFLLLLLLLYHYLLWKSRRDEFFHDPLFLCFLLPMPL